MGLIRKTLAVGTVGIVKPSSKKQRVAKKSLKEMQAQTAELKRQTAILDGSFAREQERQAQEALRRQQAVRGKLERKALDAVCAEQWRAGADPSAKNVSRLRAAEARVQALGLPVTDRRTLGP